MIEHIKKIHFVGVGGIGMSALALLMHEQGKAVSGSDLTPSLITERLQKNGIKIFSGHATENIAEDVDLVVYTSATPEDNVERDRARELGITEWSYGGWIRSDRARWVARARFQAWQFARGQGTFFCGGSV